MKKVITKLYFLKTEFKYGEGGKSIWVLLLIYGKEDIVCNLQNLIFLLCKKKNFSVLNVINAYNHDLLLLLEK